VPATATSGFVRSAVMVAAGVAAGAAMPGSAATPGMLGMTRGVGVPEASAGTNIAVPASAATDTASFRWRLMAVLTLCRVVPYGMMLME
jgi:hypothetical protein